jgi:Domain of unknown function (DUF4265)
MAREEHLLLHVEGSEGKEPVHVEHRDDGTFKVLFSPGLVEGIAAGDVIRLVDAMAGTFEILRRGGNISIKLVVKSNIRPVLEWLEPRLPPIHARVDGHVERAAVITVPAASGFPRIEGEMSEACARFEGLAWYYGNVYDAAGRPLNWWSD